MTISSQGPGSPPPIQPDLGRSPGPGTGGPGLGQRILWLFTTPRRVFEAPRGRSLWLTPLVVLSLLVATKFLLLQDLQMARVRASIEQNEKIPEEQKERILERMGPEQKNPTTEAIQMVGGVAGYWVFGYLVPALLYLFAINFVLGSRSRFGEVFTVTAFTGLISLPGEVLRLPLMLAKGSLDVYTSPAAFVPSGSTPLIFALNLFDVFELYRLFVMAAGLALITALPIRRTAFAVIAVWLLYGIVGVGCALSPIGQYMR